MDVTALHYALRGWYEGDAPTWITTLRCDPSRIWLSGMLLAQRFRDKTVVVNNFHWPHVKDAELRALVEAMPWDRMVFVCSDGRGDSLAGDLTKPSAIRTFQRVVEHPTLGIGPVISEGNGCISCMLSGRRRDFIAADVLKKQLLVDLSPVFKTTVEQEILDVEGQAQ